MKSYEIQGGYGFGYETLVSESSEQDAKALLRDYNENERGFSHRIIVVEDSDGNSSGCKDRQQ